MAHHNMVATLAWPRGLAAFFTRGAAGLHCPKLDDQFSRREFERKSAQWRAEDAEFLDWLRGDWADARPSARTAGLYSKK